MMVIPSNGDRRSMATRQRAFTMMEMLAVIAVIAILATLAVPSYLERIVRDQIKSALPLADIAKQPIARRGARRKPFLPTTPRRVAEFPRRSSRTT
jgi:prepilin-type N-terminal cleavage/methylation domain-containing protein